MKRDMTSMTQDTLASRPVAEEDTTPWRMEASSEAVSLRRRRSGEEKAGSRRAREAS